MFGLIVLLRVRRSRSSRTSCWSALNEFVEEDARSPASCPKFLPLLPGELAAGALAAILVDRLRRRRAADTASPPSLVLLIFQHLTVALLRSEERAEHLQARSRQLVGLQLGVLRTLVRALGMRDETTGRHAAAVASYATALASELGCNEEERDVARAAGLLHEIGKFTWPDRVLHATEVEDEDLAIVKNHPQEGAILVGRARRLRAGGRRDPLPPRAHGRQRLSRPG